jgi:prepilin-type N-terminal cleavage/methylation domain-containing protein
MEREPVNQARRPEEGFTLVELLITVMIMSMVIGALASVFVTSLNASRPTTQRIHESNDAQLIASFLVRDAQAAGGTNPSTGTLDSSLGVSKTDDAGCTAPGNLVLRFKWLDRASLTVSHLHVANYSYDSSAKELARTTCVDGSAPSTLTLGNSVAAVSATCTPAANCPGLPDSVAMTITATNNPNNAPTPYTYTLTASLRPESQTAPDFSNSALVPLLALGGGSGCAGGDASGLHLLGNATVRVYGDVILNTPNNGCSAAMVSGGASSYTVGTTSILAGGTCSGGNCPASVGSFPSVLPDPFAGLGTPPGVPAGACTGSNPPKVAGHYQPGVYPSLLTVSSDSVFDAGVYIFCAGLSITGGTVTGSGLLFYFKGGTLATSGNATVTLTTAAAGAYAGLLIWQPRTNTTSPMSIQGNAVLTFNGTIYAPGAEVDLIGTADTTITSLVAQRFYIEGNHAITIGTPPATPLSISAPAILPNWTRNRPYPATTMVATGGSGVNGWSATGLPAGLSINATTGTISGTPTVSGTFTVVVNVVDSLGDTASRTYALTINPAPVIATSSLPEGEQALAYSATLAGSSGTTPHTWSASGLPGGLSLNASSGVISGTPTGTGTSSVVVTLTDAAGATATKSLSLTIYPKLTISGPASLPAWTRMRPYPATTVAATGGTGSYSWSATGLPAGMSINASTGVISGTPTANGVFTVNVTVTDMATPAVSANRSYSLTINAPPSITTTACSATTNNAFSSPLGATGGTGSLTWSASGLPAWASVSSSGQLTGTAPSTGSATFALTVTDVPGASGSASFTITVVTGGGSC